MVSSISPSLSSSRRSPTNGADDNHTVRSGDTLMKIARENGVTLRQLLDANPNLRANPNRLMIGQEVVIPSQAAPVDNPVASPEPSTARPNPNTSRPPAPRPPVLVAPGDQQATRPGALTGADRIIDRTARTEGNGRYDAWNPNDVGHGVSFGLIQFNQDVGGLPNLMRAMHERNPTKFNEIFGGNAALMRDPARVRAADLNRPEIKSAMLRAARDPEMQQVQRDQAKTEYYDPAQRAGARHGITSERGLAMLFDASVQLGVGGMTSRLNRAAAGGGGEMAILTRFAASADSVEHAGGRRTHILHAQDLSNQPPTN